MRAASFCFGVGDKSGMGYAGGGTGLSVGAQPKVFVREL